MSDKYRDISDDQEVIDFVKKISSIDFKKLEFADVGKMLSVPFFEMKNDKQAVKKARKELLKTVFCHQYIYSDCNDSGIVFFFSPDYLYNLGYIRMFESVVSLVEDKNIIKGQAKKRIRLLSPKIILLYYKWIKQMNNINIKNDIKKIAALCMLKAYIECEKVKKYINDKQTVLVTFCDVHLIDSIVAQYASSRGMMTVTLQHGHFNANDRGWVFHNSVSDCFLVHGEYAINEAVKSGLRRERLVPVGMMNYIGFHHNSNFKQNENIFALILNGPGAKKDNKSFIMLANKLAKKYNMKYITRSHPVVSIEEYKDILDKRYWIEECSKDKSVYEMADSVYFCLVGNSTVFMELIYIDKPVFRYVGICQDIYENVDWCAFKNEEELCNLYVKYIAEKTGDIDNKVKETKEYLCCSGNVDDNYREFFKRMEKYKWTEN